MPYSRSHPSPRYLEMARMYETMHAHGAPEYGIEAQNMFPGASLAPHLPAIKALAGATGAQSLLDYGSGKGQLYQAQNFDLGGQRISSVKDYLGLDTIRCFDPGVPEYSELPTGKFDGVVSTDVVEHIPEEDVSWVLGEMFALADKFVFANIANYPAAKLLPNGENAHVTQKPPEWWRAIVKPIAEQHPQIRYKILIEEWDKPKGLRSWLRKIKPSNGRRYRYTTIKSH